MLPCCEPVGEPEPELATLEAPCCEPVGEPEPELAPLEAPCCEPVGEPEPELAPLEAPCCEPVAEPDPEPAPLEAPCCEPVAEPEPEPAPLEAPCCEPFSSARDIPVPSPTFVKGFVLSLSEYRYVGAPSCDCSVFFSLVSICVSVSDFSVLHEKSPAKQRSIIIFFIPHLLISHVFFQYFCHVKVFLYLHQVQQKKT